MNFKTYKTMDVNLLLGLVNTSLRNECSSFDDLIKTHDLDAEVLIERLAEIEMTYAPEQNQFKHAGTV